MKKYISVLLILSMLLTLFSGCDSKEQPPELSENAIEAAVPEFTDLSDPELLTWLEGGIYASLEGKLASDDYRVEDVEAVYLSQEYLEEKAYNSRENQYFGYTLSELDAQFAGDRYVFTLGEDGKTVVQKLESIEDETFDKVLKNVAAGGGVILICTTVSALTAGAGAPAMIHAVFAAAAKSAAAYAASGTVISGAMAGAVKAYQTGDAKEAMRAAAVEGAKGLKWGAITGAVLGGAQAAIQFKRIPKPQQSLTPREAEKLALKKYKGEEQRTFLNGEEVAYGTAGATRPDIVRMYRGKLEAIEVKYYDLNNSANCYELGTELRRQVSDRLSNLPDGASQRIVLVTKGKMVSKETVKSAIAKIRGVLDDLYPNIPIDVIA